MIIPIGSDCYSQELYKVKKDNKGNIHKKRKGMIIATQVVASASSTVFFLPAFPIRIPVGMEKMANQRNTIIGSVPAIPDERLKSFLT